MPLGTDSIELQYKVGDRLPFSSHITVHTPRSTIHSLYQSKYHQRPSVKVRILSLRRRKYALGHHSRRFPLCPRNRCTSRQQDWFSTHPSPEQQRRLDLDLDLQQLRTPRRSYWRSVLAMQSCSTVHDPED